LKEFLLYVGICIVINVRLLLLEISTYLVLIETKVVTMEVKHIEELVENRY
jgi:hypothetical protein